MRRQLIMVLAMLLTSVALVSFGNRSAAGASVAKPPPPLATLRTSDGDLRFLSLEPIEGPDGPLAVNAGPPSDECDLAPTLGIGEGGYSPDIRLFNSVVDGTDPILSCMWGNPADQRGYRTAWYKLQPNAYGFVSISTRSSNYDTVLAVHTGACGALVEVACNDDDNYFTSRVELQVEAGETYYVEVADWHSAASGQMVLNLATASEPIESFWELASAGSTTDSFRSRHAVVADGTKLYVIAGQTSIGSSANRTPTMYAYNTATGATQHLSNMPGGSDGRGYSNTTAVLIDGKIYMPAGYTGINDGTHWVYNIATDTWSDDPIADNSWSGDEPAIFSQATAYGFSGPPGNGYFLSGGMTGVFPVSDNSAGWAARHELYFYSIDSNSWIQLNSMPVGRFGHVAARQKINNQDHLCVAGGMGGTPGENREVWESTYCFNTSLGTWSEFAPLNRERYFASSAVDNQGNWYVFGGYDNSDNLVGIMERYDARTNKWIVLNPGFSVVPTRAWSRGAYVGDILWIIGGEIVNQSVTNLVQKTELFRGSHVYYFPVLTDGLEADTGHDTFATADPLSFPAAVRDRFLTPLDMVNIYGFDVPAPRQPVRIKLEHLNSGYELDFVLYTANKGFVAASRQPGTITEDITIDLSPGQYFLAVERIIPLAGFDPPPKDYRLQLLRG